MSSINKAIHEINKIDEIASRDQWVNNIHPLVKLFITIFYIFVVVSFSKYDLMGILSMFLYPFFMFELTDISFKDALHRLRIILPLVCMVGIFNPFFDHSIKNIGGVLVYGGVISMITLMCKGIFTVLASYILIATTTIEKICYALSILHVPKILVTQVLLIYRYINVLLAEASRMSQAYSLRAPGQKGVHYKVWGTFLGQLLLRSVDRADVLYESMTLRGYKGEFYHGLKQKLCVKDMIFFGICFLTILIFRFVPIFVVIGNIFV